MNPVYSKQMTSMDDINNIDKPKLSNKTEKLDKDHWAYKRLLNITEKYGLLVGESGDFFESDKPLTRNEAALILVSLIGKIREDNADLSSVEQEQMQILKEEFEKEIAFISGRMDELEDSVRSIEGRVTKIETVDSKNVKYSFGENMKLQTLIRAKYSNLIKRASEKEKGNFDVPFARIRLEGKAAKHFGYRVDIRPDTTFNNTTRRGILNNAWVYTDIIPYHKLYAGQMRIPVGYEGDMSPEDLILIERSQISRNFANRRDIGSKLEGSTQFFDYKAAIFNGQGYNAADTVNTRLDYGLWGVIKPLALKPQLGSLKLGGGYYNGKYGTGSRDTVFDNHYSNTVSCYGQYDYKKFSVFSEYSKKDGYGSSFDVKADGWYVSTAYFITDKLQLVGRFDQFRPDFSDKSNKTREYTAGLNYFFNNKNLKMQFNYVFVDNFNFQNGHKLVLLTQYLL
jgi:hypothetical protein